MHGLYGEEKTMRYNKEIVRLEQNKQYKGAAKLAFEAWEADNTNEALLSAALEIWYVIFNDYYLGVELSNDRDMLYIWNRIVPELNNKMSEDTEIMFYFGYMIKVGFYMFIKFFNEPDVDKLISRGISFMEKAYDAEPENPIYRIQHLRDVFDGDEEAFYEVQRISKEYEDDIRRNYQGEGMLNAYFRSIYLVGR